MKTRTINNIMALGLAILTVSCATKQYTLYDGSALRENEVAVLVNAKPRLSPVAVLVDEVDGKKPDDGSRFYGSKWDGSFRIQLKPGSHTVLVRYYQGEAQVQPWKPVGEWDVIDTSHGLLRDLVTFDAEAGKTYTITKWDLSDGRLRAWVGEVTDKKK